MSRRCSRLAAVAVITLAVQAVVAPIGVRQAHGAFAYFVTTLADNLNDDGLCTLREAMYAANDTPFNADCGPGSADSDFIFFAMPGTIVLGSALPTITQGVRIVGHGSGGNTLDGNGRARPFRIDRSIDVTLERLTIVNGKARDGAQTICCGPIAGEHGGAIYNAGRLDLRDVRITHSKAGNGTSSFESTGIGRFATAGGSGGAIYNYGTIVGYRVTFDENRAGEGGLDYYKQNAGGGHGGGIYNEEGGRVTLFAATLTGNAQGVTGHGAALYNRGEAFIRASTFAGNGIPGGSGNWSIVSSGNSGWVVLSSTIMADRLGCLSHGVGGALDVGWNLGLVDRPGLGACGFTPTTGSIVDSSGLPVVDAQLRNNGGYVPTLALLPTHPAVNRIPATFEDCAEGKLVILGLPSTLTDARGVERPQNGRCDMGAFELGPAFRRGLRALAITAEGSGDGTVSAEGLDCAIAEGVGTGRCSAEYGTGTVVTLTATAEAGSIFVGWEGDPECADGSVLMDGDKRCTAIFDLRGASVSGSASRVGKVPAPVNTGSGQVKFSAKFAFAGVVDLASATVTVNALLAEEGDGGAGELVQGLPVVLRARPGGRSTAAIFETPSGAPAAFKINLQIRQPALSTVTVAVDRATLPRFPALCAVAARPATTLTTMFTIDDGIHPPVTVTSREPWRCLDPSGGDPLEPRSLRTP